MKRPLWLLGAVLAGVAVVAWLTVESLWPATAPERHAAPPPLMKARSAEAFVDSIGVNTHLFFGDTAYANFPAVRARLLELGVHWIRDGACSTCAGYVDHLNQLAAAGIRSQLIFGVPTNGQLWFDGELAAIRDRLRLAVGALEGPNEYDGSPDPAWSANLRAWQRQLYARVKADPTLRALPVVGPTVIKPGSREVLGDLSGSLDLGNLHPYTAGLMPTTRHIDDERRRAHVVSGDKPLIATEGGFHTALRMPDGANQPPVDERTQADYLQRMFLDHWISGLRRTFSYELVDTVPNPGDDDGEDHFGLLHNDFSPKPSFDAVRNLIAVLRSVGRSDRARAVRLALDLPGDGHHLLLSRADGSFALVLWRDVPAWDTVLRRPRVVDPEDVGIRLGTPMLRAETIVPGRTAAPIATLLRPATMHVSVAAAPVVVRLTPAPR